MGTLADSLFALLMSWVRALVNGLWALFSSEDTTVLGFLGKHWMMIAVVIIAAGLVIDWLIWMARWQPYHIWVQRLRRLFGMDDGEAQEEAKTFKAHAAMPPERRNIYERQTHTQPEEDPEEEDILEDAYYPQNDLFIDEPQDQPVHADEMIDEEMGAYPGMLYGTQAEPADLSGTRRYSALTAEGPGSAEVARRRAEIDAWQLQMQEEARARAQAEHRAREEEAARIAEEQRRAREEEAARIAEEQRRAREEEEARVAEEQRLAQEEYARQMAEYEMEKARYERELAEYERQKAEYDAQMESLARQQSQSASQETAQELEPAPARRRRNTTMTYGDYVGGEEVTHLPDPPQWPQAEKPKPVRKKSAGKPMRSRDGERSDARAKTAGPGTSRGTAAKGKTVRERNDGSRPGRDVPAKNKPAKGKPAEGKPAKGPGLLSRMSKMMEPKEDEIASFSALPPRVDMHDAYKPAKTPQGEEHRRR